MANASRTIPAGSLYGTTLAQILFYYVSFPQDNKITKAVVSLMHVYLKCFIIDNGTGLYPLVGCQYLHSVTQCYLSDSFYQYLRYSPCLPDVQRIMAHANSWTIGKVDRAFTVSFSVFLDSQLIVNLLAGKWQCVLSSSTLMLELMLKAIGIVYHCSECYVRRYQIGPS